MRRLAWETTVLSEVPSRLVVQFGRGREAARFRRSGNFEMHGGEIGLHLRMRCINSMPEMVTGAFRKRLNPSITLTRDLTWR